MPRCDIRFCFRKKDETLDAAIERSEEAKGGCVKRIATRKAIG